MKIECGDISLDMSGNTQYVSGAEELLQKALFCLMTPRGSFRYNRSFGCAEIGEITDSRSLKNAQGKLNEAIAPIQGAKLLLTFAENTPRGVKLGFTLTRGQDKINSEVTLR